MNNDYDAPFSAEEIDEHVEHALQRRWSRPASVRPPPGQRLIEDVQRAYPADDEATAQALGRVRRRLARSAPRFSEGNPARRRRRSQPEYLYSSGAIPPRMPADDRRGRSFPARIVAIAAAVLLVAVIGSLAVGLILVRQHGPVVANQSTLTPGQTAQSTQPPPPSGPAIAYIGNDNNVWVMSWPGGTPRQLTTDAKAGTPTYSGLVWSPDGSLLAVEKGDPGQIGSLVILKPDGTVVVNVHLSWPSYNEVPFAWSPDSKTVAFRGDVTVGSPDPNNGMRKLLLFDAHTGQIVKTLTYAVGGFSGCGGGGPTSDLTQEIWNVDHVGFEEPKDAFAWSPDGHTLLFTRVALNSCGAAQGIEIDVGSGATNAPYPYAGSYQPGGNLILGYWSDGTLGLTDLSANHVRGLVRPEPYVNPPQYMVLLGQSVWSSDGQTIYYEHDDSIWRIGVDGSNATRVVAGTALDSQDNATLQLVPSPSPDGQMLLYLQASGSNRVVDSGDPTPQPTPTIPLTTQWYVAHADGSNPVALPQGVKEAAWRPGK